MNKTDEQLAHDAKQVFDQSVDGLDAATLSRLNRGRQAAHSRTMIFARVKKSRFDSSSAGSIHPSM